MLAINVGNKSIFLLDYKIFKAGQTCMSNP